ncbi:nucleotidyltransferase [hot springs metagenome]|uniref:Nucleotidyltransferase n=1 Tax=hot springs metagenome TaxID=433727 RepID=A0A5J4KX23_9ZZZZ
MKKEDIISILKSLNDIIKTQYHAEVVGIFGSYVRGEEKATSDIDVLVKFDEQATLFDLVGLGDYLEEQFHIKVDIVPIDTIKKEIKEEVLKEAIYI